MKQDLTDIVLVIDRSGSMTAMQSDAEGGINSFIKKQAELPGEARLSLVQFDTEYEFVHRMAPIKEVPHFHLVPRGWTALLDAVGRAIVETGERLATMAEDDRPGLVVFVIVTDGQENSSKEFTKTKIKEMIEHQQSAYKWQFTFLGANQDAFAEAHGLGIPAAAAANYSPAAAGAMFAAASSSTGRMRHQAATGQSVQAGYSAEERKSMEE